MYKKFNKLIILFILSSLNSNNLSANNKDPIYRKEFLPNSCKILYNNGHNIPKPNKFHKNNNLLKKSNKNSFAMGQKMILEGYILDKNCNPIQNATVKIWQKNNFGIYQDENYLKNLNHHKDNPQEYVNNYNPNFTSNGSISTDNTGYFYFITLVPCYDSKNESCSPEIEISVSDIDSKKSTGFEGHILIPEIDRVSINKYKLLNKNNFDEDYIADLKEFRPEYLKFQYNISIDYAVNYRKH